jgi:hypothetical protein
VELGRAGGHDSRSEGASTGRGRGPDRSCGRKTKAVTRHAAEVGVSGLHRGPGVTVRQPQRELEWQQQRVCEPEPVVQERLLRPRRRGASAAALAVEQPVLRAPEPVATAALGAPAPQRRGDCFASTSASSAPRTCTRHRRAPRPMPRSPPQRGAAAAGARGSNRWPPPSTGSERGS